MPKIINGLKFVQTCIACPEQYNVFSWDKQVGYVRLRNGDLTVDYPDVHGVQIFQKDFGEVNNWGSFDNDDQREKWLGEVATTIIKHLVLAPNCEPVKVHLPKPEKSEVEAGLHNWLSHLQHQVENRLIKLYHPKRFTGSKVICSKEKMMVRFREIHPIGRGGKSSEMTNFLMISISPEFHYLPEIPRTHEQNMNAIAMRTAARDALCNEKLDGLMEVLKSLNHLAKVPSTTVVDYDYSIECTGGHLRLIDRLHLPGLLVRISQDLRYFDLVIEPKVPTAVIGSTSQDNLLVLCDIDTKAVPTGQGSLTIKKTDRPVGVKEAIAEGNDVMRIEFSSKGDLDSVMKLLEEMRKEWTRQERELTKGQRLD